MKKLIFIGLSCLAVQVAQAVEPEDIIFTAPITLCEKSETGHFQYNLTLTGNGQLGVITGTADATHQRLCANNINVVGQYGQQKSGSYLVTLTTLTGETGNCDAWVYQMTWNGASGKGQVTFLNDESEAVNFDLGACPEQ